MGSYILTVTAAAVIVSISGSFFNEKSTVGSLVRMVGGLFLAFVMLSPVADWDYDGIASFAQSYEILGKAAAGKGKDLATEQTRTIIKEKACAYILDKAETLRTTLAVEVVLSNDEIPIPESVYLSGQVSPFAKQQLQHLIETELGIPKERQIWTG